MLWRFAVLVIPLGIDSFVVAAALGLRGVGGRERLRISALFTAFEGGMPLIGVLLGRPIGAALGRSADYVTIGVLIAFGLFTLFYETDEEDQARRLVDARVLGAIVLGFSVSLDELAIGFTLGLLRLPLVPVLVAIAVQAFVVSQLGLRLGDRLSERLREAGEKVAGLALTGLGVGLLIERVVA